MDRRVLLLLLLCTMAAAVTNCGVETNDGPKYDIASFANPNATPDASLPDAGDADAVKSDASILPSSDCHAAVTGETLPARTVTLKTSALPKRRRVFVDDMFNLFRSLCGACHIDGNQGNWQTSRLGFNQTKARESLVSMLRNDSLEAVMPPGSVGGKLAKDRTQDDPSVELIRMLKSYITAGSPPQSYEEDVLPSAGEEPVAAVDPREASPYRFDPEVAKGLTSLGNCIPDKGLYATATDRMTELDDFFGSIAPKNEGSLLDKLGFPPNLADTDLFTFDSAELARQGVITWSVNYPLFHDNARSIRHVRVPLGESIKFDKATQQFKIPWMTRFYKTLLKPIVEQDGSLRWRKMETQLIVAYDDDDTLGQGHRAVTALHATYVWNEDETAATLVTDPLKNSEPFRDHMLTYVADETLADTIIKDAATRGEDPGYNLLGKGALHHYVTPGVRRCVECHMGSPSQNFVLGFQPLQIKRYATGQQGVRVATGRDDLNQLERFIDYGLITGASPDDILSLDSSQGERKPRNEHELTAQGYLIPACANCHSRRGAATLYNPELKEALDFQPSAGGGGIFQFPLERYSTRIFRSGTEKIPIPYITPSLFDLPWGNSKYQDSTIYAPKCTGRDIIDGSATGLVGVAAEACSLAPWRSLIYRGMDTPFTYSDDLALFPRMPVHTAGFDCAAPQIVAKWMISIPAVRKENPFAVREDTYLLPASFRSKDVIVPDTQPQPYREVLPGDAGYSEAVAAAAQRLDVYTGARAELYSGYPRYDYCPGNSDIVDPDVLKNPVKKPTPVDGITRSTSGAVTTKFDGVPDTVHWVILDQTEVKGDWYPRRFDWDDIVVRGNFPKISNTPQNAGLIAAQIHEKLVVEVLQKMTISDSMRVFASKKIPMALWQQKPQCKFPRIPTLKQYTSSSHPAWMDSQPVVPLKGTDAPVYLIAPGEYVYNQVCMHCHGTRADSAGREATTLSDMTGGYAAVTNFKTGVGDPYNRLHVFSKFANEAVTPDDWAARYYAWMGLGGTKQQIPRSILSVVATTDVFGKTRPQYAPPKDANMLSSPEDLCKWTLPAEPQGSGEFGGAISLRIDTTSLVDMLNPRTDKEPFIDSNGDREVWQKLCLLDNPRPLRAFTLKFTAANVDVYWQYQGASSSYAREAFPDDALVVDQNGRVTKGIQLDNASPWCLRKPSTGAGLTAADQWRTKNTSADGTQIPYCPEKTKAGAPYVVPRGDSDGAMRADDKPLSQAELSKWAIRGAVNAGFATFIHVDNLTQGLVKPTPNYNECEMIQ